jgi:hypothetical protein
MAEANLFKWRQYQPEIIVLCVRWYLRYALSYRDLEELMAERGLGVDHTTVFRWVQRYAPELDSSKTPSGSRPNRQATARICVFQRNPTQRCNRTRAGAWRLSATRPDPIIKTILAHARTLVKSFLDMQAAVCYATDITRYRGNLLPILTPSGGQNGHAPFDTQLKTR